MDSTGLLTALETIEPEAMEAQADVARLERELRVAQDRAQRLLSIVENLRALAGREAPADDASEQPVNGGGAQPYDAGPVEVVPWEPPKPRRPSATKLVAEVVYSGSAPMTREQITEVMAVRGYTEGMQKPASNINVAIKRAVEQGLIFATLDGRYHPSGRGADAADQENDGRAQDQLVDGSDGDPEM